MYKYLVFCLFVIIVIDLILVLKDLNLYAIRWTRLVNIIKNKNNRAEV